jgi:predicted NUDIX family NTP pyrophosphohydrolase
VHPGGPFWAKKDLGSWSIPKGEVIQGEDPRSVARREFTEELGAEPPSEGWVSLGELRQASGKVVIAWTSPGDFDTAGLKSNVFTIEWPPKSGRIVEFPEVDRAQWFSLDDALARILPGQVSFLDLLPRILPPSETSGAVDTMDTPMQPRLFDYG